MAEGVGNAIKYGLAGIVVGTATGAATDLVYSKIAGYASWSGEGNVSKSAVNVIVAGSIAAGFMFGGDMFLEASFDIGKDPLFRILFYQSAFLSQNTVKVAVGGVRTLMNGVAASIPGSKGGYSPPSQIPVLGPAQMPAPRSAAPPPATNVVSAPQFDEHPMLSQYGGPSNCSSGGTKTCGQNRLM